MYSETSEWYKFDIIFFFLDSFYLALLIMDGYIFQ